MKLTATDAWRVTLDGKIVLLCRDYYGLLWIEERKGGGKVSPGRREQKLLAGQVKGAASVATTRANALNLYRYTNPRMAHTTRGERFAASCGNCGEPAPGCPVCARGAKNLLIHQRVWIEGVLVERIMLRWLQHCGQEQVRLGRVQLAWPHQGLSPTLACFLVVLTDAGPVLVPETDHAKARHDTPRWEKQPLLWPELTLSVALPPLRSPANDTAGPSPKDPPCAEKLPWLD